MPLGEEVCGLSSWGPQSLDVGFFPHLGILWVNTREMWICTALVPSPTARGSIPS